MNLKKVISVKDEEKMTEELVSFAASHGLTQSLWQHISALVVKEFQHNATLKQED